MQNMIVPNQNLGLLSQQQALANALMEQQGQVTPAQPASFAQPAKSIDPSTLMAMKGSSPSPDMGNDFIQGKNQGGFSGTMNGNADASLPWSTNYVGNNANATLPWLDKTSWWGK